MEILVLNEDEVRGLLDPRALLDALADGFRALSRGEVTAPDRNEVTLDSGAFLLGMPGCRGTTMAVKVVTVFEASVPSHLATIGLYDVETGACRAFIDGTFITALRTSAAAALATGLLAREDARTLAIVGAGVQGAHHLLTFPLVREFDEIRIASLYREDAERLAATHPRARATTIRQAVDDADVVALAPTPPRP
jgi:ornithine cyclodeaminase/alanine dehydrogenase-like protein (mu-crystallin family)